MLQNFYYLLSKKEKKIKKDLSFLNSSYINQDSTCKVFYIMDDKKEWLLMTYYCPIHGDSGFVRPIELTKKEIREKFLKKSNKTKN